jgi:hypothetical protein
VEKVISNSFQVSNIKIIKLQQMMIHLLTPKVSPYKMFKGVINGEKPKKLRESQKSL